MIPKAIKKGGEVENKENLNEKPTYEQWFNQIKFNTVGGYILPDGTKGIGKKSNESWFKKLYNNRFGEKENLKGGVADKKTIEQIAKEQGIENMFYVYNQLKKGISVEMEHTTDKDIAKEIALDHLSENMDYYIELEKMEKKLETEKKTKTQETEQIQPETINEQNNEAMVTMERQPKEVKQQDVKSNQNIYFNNLMKLAENGAELRELEDYIFNYLAGDRNKASREELMSYIQGRKVPINESGITAIFQEILKIISNKYPDANTTDRFEPVLKTPITKEGQEIIKIENKSNDRPSQESHQRFSEVQEIDRNLITTMPKLFQGRQHDYSEESVNKIVSEGFDKSNDPIIVWWDKDMSKYVVISGHSRWEASKRLYEGGDLTLSKMPVKIFLGDKEEAMSYAILESNRASTQEGLVSDINAVSKMLKEGYNKTEMLKYIKPKSYLENIVNYTYLNPNGKFIEYLAQPSNKSFPYLERNAGWVGEMRKLYKDKLTDLHESEIFDYLYVSGNTKGLKLTKNQFYNVIDSKVMKMDYDANKPLNLQNIVSTSAITSPARQAIKDMEAEVDYWNKEIQKKQDLIVQARQQGKPELADKFQQFISDATKKVISIKEQINKLETDTKKLETQVVYDLFSGLDDSPVMQQIKSEIIIDEMNQAKDQQIKDSEFAVSDCNNELVQFSKTYNKEILQINSNITINGTDYIVTSFDSEKIKFKSNLGRFNTVSNELILGFDELIKLFNSGKVIFDGYSESDKSLFDLMIKSKQICLIREDNHKAIKGSVEYSINKVVSMSDTIKQLAIEKVNLENELSETKAEKQRLADEKQAELDRIENEKFEVKSDETPIQPSETSTKDKYQKKIDLYNSLLDFEDDKDLISDYKEKIELYKNLLDLE